MCPALKPRLHKPLAPLHVLSLTDVDDLVAAVYFKLMLGDSDNAEFGVFVSVGFVKIDNVLA